MLEGTGEGSGEILCPGHVAMAENGNTALRAGQIHRLAATGLVEIGDDHLRASSRKGKDGGAADA
ncbi:MAG: hypothetical protein IPN07_04285 [Dehalococcoidia bacterium]|nr:hypothetical protein [Dehalococcoidia bacterium]